MLDDREDPEAVAHVIEDAIRNGQGFPDTFADSLAPHAARLGLRHDDGVGLMRWLLDLVGDPDAPRWVDEAREHVDRAGESVAQTPAAPRRGRGAT